MKKYFSIGEFSKIKGVGIKSLRYYDKIGVLKPAYVNEETGYRYYSVEQLFFLDTVILCIELGMPLKKFADYMDENGTIHLESFLSEAQKRMEKKLKRLQNGIRKTGYILNNIEEHQLSKEQKKAYVKTLPCRNIVKLPFDGQDYNTEFAEKLTQLVLLCEENELTTTYLSGLLYIKTGETIESYIYIEILEEKASIPEFTLLPKGNYKCLCYENTLVHSMELVLNECIPERKTQLIVEADVFESTIRYDKYTIELQVLID